MLRQLSIILFLFLSLSCQKDSVEVIANFDNVSGTWHLAEIEKGNYGKKFWEKVNSQPSDIRIFHTDGTILDKDGLMVCCVPNSVSINGRLLTVKKDSLLNNPLCGLVECTNCDSWEIEWENDQIIITYCDGSRFKYLRY